MIVSCALDYWEYIINWLIDSKLILIFIIYWLFLRFVSIALEIVLQLSVFILVHHYVYIWTVWNFELHVDKTATHHHFFFFFFCCVCLQDPLTLRNALFLLLRKVCDFYGLKQCYKNVITLLLINLKLYRRHMKTDLFCLNKINRHGKHKYCLPFAQSSSLKELEWRSSS